MTKEEIKELVNMFAEANISKIKIKEQDGFEIELEREVCEISSNRSVSG